MSEDATTTEEISGSDNSSDPDSVDYPDSDVDSNVLSISDESSESGVVQPENGASLAISVLSEERRIEEITFSGQVSFSMTARRMSSMTDDSLYADEFSPAFSWRQSEESNESDTVEVSSGNETSADQAEEATSEIEQPVPQPGEAPSANAPSVPQPGEALSEIEQSVPEPSEAPSENAPSVPQPGEVPSETVPQPGEVPSEPSMPSSVTEPVVQLRVIQPPHVIPFPKRRRVISPEKKSPEKNPRLQENVDDEDCCSICFESWTTSGNHRPAALKCGHLFGFLCIDKWLKGQGEKCPQCNAKAKRPDIRIIFTRNIKAVDTTERDHALEQLSHVQKRNTELMMETAHLGLKYQVVMSECNRLQTELSKSKEEILVLKCKLNRNNATSSSQFPCTQDIEGIVGNGMMDVTNQLPERGKFVRERCLTIYEGGNCRVMTYSPFLGTIAVSQPSSISLFPGFGVKKISSLDFKTTEYMTLHSKAIRNLCFHPSHQDGVLLSCSLDKTVKLTSMISNTVVQCYNLPMGAWSCVWNTDDHNYFYVGLQNGLVQEYDVRNTNSCSRELNCDGSRSPVASLQYVSACPNSPFRPGGLLVGQLNRVSFYEKIPGNEYKTHLLPLEGNISSLCFEPHTRQMLASFRSSTSHPKVRHMICELGMIDESVCGCNIVQTFYGGSTQTLLSRSLLVPHPQNSDHLLVCAGDEASQGVKIWNGNSFRFTQDVPCEGSVVDLCYINVTRPYLLALTDKRLKFHEWKE